MMLFFRLFCKIEKLWLICLLFFTSGRLNTQRSHFRCCMCIFSSFRYPEFLKLDGLMLFLCTLDHLALLELWWVNKGYNLYFILVKTIAHIIFVFLELGCHCQFGAARFDILDTSLTFFFVYCLTWTTFH